MATADRALDRQVIRVSGSDRISFLKGLTTKDPEANGMAYSALLTPQGKYLADFFLVDTGDAVLIDAHAEQAAGLLQRLSLYKLRADVTLEASDVPVYRGTGPRPDGAYDDPRDGSLGWRFIGSLEPATPTGLNWDHLRVAACIPEAGIELIPNDSYILEMGFERMQGVDFKKGCYVGQEVTARMKHKTELKKGLERVRVLGDAPVGTVIEAGGKPAGTLYTQVDGEGLAYLMFNRAKGPLTAGSVEVQRTSGARSV